MATSKAKKQVVLSLLENEVKNQKSVIFLTTKNAQETLNAEKNFKLRKQARNSGVVIKVVKNSLLKKTFPDLDNLEGQTYMAFLEIGPGDEVQVPKAMVDIVKTGFEKEFQIIGSLVAGEIYDEAKTKILANTLTKEESLSQIAGSLQQIIAKIALTVKEVNSSLARGVDAVKNKKA